MKKIALSTFIILIMTINIKAEESNGWIIDGNLRVGYQNHTQDNKTLSETALGVNISIKTPIYKGFGLGATLSSTLGNGEKGFDGVAFFDENNQDYATIREAYINYSLGETLITLGRQTIDTPYADSDDIGMIPNSFEALTIVNQDIADTTITLAHLQKWSGVDSDIQSKFTELNGNKGMQVLGIEYEGITDTKLSGWFYNLSNEMTISYIEAEYSHATTSFDYGLNLQYTYQDYDNGDTSTIYGIATSISSKDTGLTATIAYNKTKGVEANNLFGGGPFYTNAEHNTLKEAGIDGDMILYTIEWDASVVGIEELSMKLNIDTHKGEGYDAREYDVGFDYQYSKDISLGAVYSNIDDRAESFQNLRVFFNYGF
ncbi:MAG: OprD family outer membrane porin [Sulfurovum sp.]